MADLIGILAVTHNPSMWTGLRESTPDDLAEVAANFKLPIRRL